MSACATEERDQPNLFALVDDLIRSASEPTESPQLRALVNPRVLPFDFNMSALKNSSMFFFFFFF